MQSLGLVLRNRGDDGDPLPCPIRSFEDVKIKFRRGQLSLIAAAPGGGKSSLAAYIAVRMAYSEDLGVPTLYVSADCDPMTMGAQVLAGVMDIPLEEAEFLIGTGDENAFAAFDEVTDHIWWTFKKNPTLQDIQEEVMAYAYVFGEYPHMIVVDNLVNINEPGEEYSRYNDIIPVLSELAGETRAHLMLLHHVTGQWQNGDQPIPRDGIKHKVSEHPRLVLTLYKPEEGMMGVRVVKHTGGPAHTKAAFGCDIPWLPERGYFGE